MDLSKLKVEVYDLFAIVIPGVLLFCELWVTVAGWQAFAKGASSISGAAFTLMVLVSFALGFVMQEAADLIIKKVKGERFFKSARDQLWVTPTGAQVRARIAQQLGHDLESVDVAFDYCLSRLQGSFAKRDLFVANSDLARSLIVVSCFALVPLTRLVVTLQRGPYFRAATLGAVVVCVAMVSKLCWSRMVRFRGHSELPVFHSYLAQPNDAKSAAAAKT